MYKDAEVLDILIYTALFGVLSQEISKKKCLE